VELGAKGVYVSEPAKLDEAVDEFAASNGACVLNVAIRRDAGRPLMN
jgi:thiamine pyrophosphate-dependent acetolactate synthase large subunit-like protein